MPITFVPDPGSILMCDFDAPGFLRPEMTKHRLCITLSPRFRRHIGTCIVVPLSTVPPTPVHPWHYSIPLGRYQCLDPHRQSWVKGDMVTHASYARLDRVREFGRFVHRLLDPDDLLAVREAVLHALALPNLAAMLRRSAIGSP